MNQGYTSDQTSFPQEFHLSDYFNIVWKRKWVAITFFLVVVCIVATKTYYTEPVYQATAQISIKGKSSFMKGMAEVSQIYGGGYKTQYNLLKSRSLAGKVTKDLQLSEYFASNRKKPNYFTLALNRVKKFISNSLSPSSYDTSKTQPTAFENQNEHFSMKQDPVVDWYLSKIDIIPVPESSLVNISFSDHSPEMAARITAAHVRAFIATNIQEQREASQNALNWLKTELRDHKINAEVSQRVLNKYTYQQLESLSIDDESLFVLPRISEHYVIKDLRKQLTKLKGQKMELNTKFGPKHHKIIEINSSIKQVEQEIINVVARLKETIKKELDQTVAVGKNIQQTQEVHKQAAEIHDEKNINYSMLNLEAESDQEIYDILLQQAKELSLTGSMEGNNIRIVDDAEVPRKPIKPKIFFNLLLSVVMGLTFGTGFAFFLAYMDKTIKIPEDVMQGLGMSVIGLLPYDKSLRINKPLLLPLPPNESPDKQQKLLN